MQRYKIEIQFCLVSGFDILMSYVNYCTVLQFTCKLSIFRLMVCYNMNSLVFIQYLLHDSDAKITIYNVQFTHFSFLFFLRGRWSEGNFTP